MSEGTPKEEYVTRRFSEITEVQKYLCPELNSGPFMHFNFLENVFYVLIFLCFLCSPCCVFPFPTIIIQWKLLPCVALGKQRKFWPGLDCGDVFGCWRKRGSTCGPALSRADSCSVATVQQSCRAAERASNSQKPKPSFKTTNKSFPVLRLWASTSVGASEAIVSLYSRVSALRLLVGRWTRSKSH